MNGKEKRKHSRKFKSCNQTPDISVLKDKTANNHGPSSSALLNNPMIGQHNIIDIISQLKEWEIKHEVEVDERES